ncbi:hypothetical protein [Wenxinia saemankumensis]|uniref:DUF3299 domain-containing protein n=1 Tax=Wenxinia saemankumensis TaxID=1447782 RepID=A0A1M6AML5_9RHOB|nr:hypothetical protein [Wenxinia saemankumensis]SHI37453.1 hypothetical protein SAMN05444417_0507 [Wenxinia saemankumensis]
MPSVSRLALASALVPAAMPAVAETDLWALIEGVTVDEIVTDTSYEVRKTFPDALLGGVENVSITGYAMPYTDMDGTVRELMLVSDMGLCPFCGSPDHPGALQVLLADAATGIEEGARITVTGDLRAVTDPETWQAAVLEGARLSGS